MVPPVNNFESFGVNTCHLIEVLVRARVSSHDIELGIKDVLAVTSVVHSVIDNQLDHDLFCIFAVE